MFEAPPNPSEASSKVKKLGLPPRLALVLGAGGVKGVAHLGVLDALYQAGITPDLIVGCSAGSLIGALYADKKAPSMAYDFVRKIVTKRSYSYNSFGVPYLRKGISGEGFFSTARMQQILSKELRAKTFEQLQIPLMVVATDLNSGRLEVFSSGPLVAPICASSAIPGIFQPVIINKSSYVDGTVITDLPVSIAKKQGASVIIAVVLRSTLHVAHQGNIKHLMTRAYNINKLHTEKHQQEMADIILQPVTDEGVGILSTDEKTFQLMYELGKRSAEEQLPKIKELLANNTPKQIPSTT